MIRMNKKTPIKIKCAYCEKSIMKTHYQKKFCSDKCRNDWHNTKKAYWVEMGKRLSREIIND